MTILPKNHVNSSSPVIVELRNISTGNYYVRTCHRIRIYNMIQLIGHHEINNLQHLPTHKNYRRKSTNNDSAAYILQ